MAKLKKTKKTYSELSEQMKAYENEIVMLDMAVRGYREHLERLTFMIEAYIEMKKDLKKLTKFIDKKIEKESEDVKENHSGNQVQSVSEESE